MFRGRREVFSMEILFFHPFLDSSWVLAAQKKGFDPFWFFE
jgi:hypothetical protein